jgi:hypothetical protein
VHAELAAQEEGEPRLAVVRVVVVGEGLPVGGDEQEDAEDVEDEREVRDDLRTPP